jgi:PmbA protein
MRKEILTVRDNETTIDVTGNQIHSIRNKDIVKKGARVFDQGQIYSASFVGNISDQDLVNEAVENRDGSMDYDYSLPTSESVQREVLLPANKNRSSLYEDYQNALEGLKKRYPHFIFSGKAGISTVTKELNVQGEFKHLVKYDICGWHLLFKHKKSASIIDGYFGQERVAGYDMAGEWNNYCKFLDVFDNTVELKNGRLPVVFLQSSRLFGKVLESSRADLYNKGIGIFKGMLGEKILNDKFSLFDVSYLPEKCAVDLFDGEGVVRNDPVLPIVQNGVFKNLICDCRNGKKYGLESTGNGQRSFDSNVSLGFNQRVLEGGDRPAEEILKGFQQCLVIEMASGGDFTDEGDYSTPVQSGYLARDGKIVGKLPQLTLKSNVKSMFGDDLLEIANDALTGIEHNPSFYMEMEVILN